MVEAAEQIDSSFRFQSEEERTTAKRIIKSLISSKSIAKAGNAEAESRVDYLADRLGVEKSDIIHSIQQMREDGLLADTKDLTAYIQKTDTANKSLLVLHRFQALETFILEHIDTDNLCINYKEMNEAALAGGVKTSSVNAIKTLFYYWTIRSYIQKEQNQATNKVMIVPKQSIDYIREKRQNSYNIAEFIIDYLFQQSGTDINTKNEVLVGFSLLELMNAYREKSLIEITENDIEEALLFLSKIGALKLEGGFLVLYGGMRIQRLILDNKIRYKIEDYKQLNEFYQHKMQQIHIVGEYANMMVRNYSEALQFVNDYFQMDYKKFLSHYFSGERAAEIERNITPQKYRQLFDTLSPRQLEIIRDNASRNIVVSAGPGSGKTKLLVHKLASLLLLEDVKQEQLLMLTFSRAAAIEFKQRLHKLMGNVTHFVEIKTFHSYCFDLLGKIGNIQDSDNIVKNAGELIRSGDVDIGKITKTVLVIDEAQDMDCYEYSFVEALMERNEDIRVIAVGDDDQNIYQFRGSDSKYLKLLISNHKAKQYSLIDNYRSSKSIISFANQFVKSISDRMKEEDINAVKDSIGEVKLIKHSGSNMETALVDDLLSVNTEDSTCILTNTNHEALLILGILKQKNIPAKLIQSIDGFDMYDIAEVRYFLKKLSADSISPIISNEQWNSAVKALKEHYCNSTCLPIILNVLHTFEETNKKKYRTDFEMFLHESKIEDFYTNEQGVITISTMHKSKGREFDNIYMLLREVNMNSDEEKRKLYVGMTRAKNLLHIHYCGDVLDKYAEFATANETDLLAYPKPSEIILQLSHKDVYLDFFKDKKQLIIHLKSGTHLTVKGNKLYILANGKMKPVLQFSSKCNENVKQLIASGYMPYDAVIRFVCAWKGKEDTTESAVILADIYFHC